MIEYIGILFAIPAIMFLALAASIHFDPDTKLSSTASFSLAVSMPFLAVSLVCLAMYFGQ